jgi:2-polyprenyl-3-methyl-5-hydroxy-6-metoxy-1,4-benzoquinol methylase
VLNKYKVRYYKCSNCNLIQTENPHWLKEAYSSAIIDSDTGILSRNFALSRITSIFVLFFANKNSKVLDFAGGYGILTRMLRDVGVDGYWEDKYAENIFAKGFNSNSKTKYDMVTAFEVFEHLVRPVKEIGDTIKRYNPKTLLFSTTLHYGNPPKDWWYFVPDGGQHVTLYTKKSLKIMANRFGMKLSTDGRNIHIFSKRQIPGLFMKFICIFWPIISIIFPLFYRSRTFSDHLKITTSE